MRHLKKCVYALILGLATMLLCIILADGMLGITTGSSGKIVFWVSIIFLPLCARKFVAWRYTLINMPLYFALYYFFVVLRLGNLHYSFFKASGGFIAIPHWWGAGITALILWGIESIVYGICGGVSLIKKAR